MLVWCAAALYPVWSGSVFCGTYEYCGQRHDAIMNLYSPKVSSVWEQLFTSKAPPARQRTKDAVWDQRRMRETIYTITEQQQQQQQQYSINKRKSKKKRIQLNVALVSSQVYLHISHCTLMETQTPILRYQNPVMIIEQ